MRIVAQWPVGTIKGESDVKYVSSTTRPTTSRSEGETSRRSGNSTTQRASVPLLRLHRLRRLFYGKPERQLLRHGGRRYSLCA